MIEDMFDNKLINYQHWKAMKKVSYHETGIGRHAFYELSLSL